MTTAYIVCGSPGAGKTSYGRKLARDKLAVFLEQGGGDYIYGASLAEDNILGYGRAIQLSGSISDEDDGYTVFFHDDRIGWTRWTGSIFY